MHVLHRCDHLLKAIIFRFPDAFGQLQIYDDRFHERNLIQVLVWVGLQRLVLLAFLLGRLRAAHAQLCKVALRLHRALMDG